MKRKSIVLSDTEEKSTKKAVLTLDEKEGGLVGTLRLYNFPAEPNGILSLGLYSDQKVFKAGLTRKSQMLYDFFVDIKEIPAKFSCAVVNFQNAEPKPMLYGSSEGSVDDIYASIINEVAGAKSFQKTKDVLEKYDVDFAEPEKHEIEEEIDDCMCKETCANCIYKKYFYENAQPPKQENKSDFKAEIFGGQEAQTLSKNFDRAEKENKIAASENLDQKDEKIEKGDNIFFFDRLKPQIDKLFENNPTENNLQNIFPYSKWAKVEYEDEGDFFVFGLLYDENGDVKYVCYGVPAVFDENPPEELDGYPIWLPLDEKQGFGYWMTYQDAKTGEPLKAILD